MKKLISAILIFSLAIACALALVACDSNRISSSTVEESGVVYELKTGEDGKKYAVAVKYALTEEDTKKVTSGNYKDIMTSVTINEYVEDGETYPVKEIEPGAFTNQLVIKELTIGDNVETIGQACLSGCINLEKLTVKFVGSTVDALNAKKTLGYIFGTTSYTGGQATAVAYSNGGATTTYYIPSALKKVVVTGDVLSDYAFYGSYIEEVELTGNITKIGEASFADMSNLTKFTVPAGVTEIGKQAFTDCTALYSIDFSKATSLKTIYQEAFAGCTLLGYKDYEVELPNSVEKIYEGAFNGCTTLKSIDLSNTAITSIPTACFYSCSELTEVILKTGTTVGNDAFGKDVTINYAN